MDAVIQFPCYIHISYDRACNQLWEQRYISAKADGILLHRHISPVDIKGVAQALERIKADADGQRQMQKRNAQPCGSIEAADKEIGILKYRQKS